MADLNDVLGKVYNSIYSTEKKPEPKKQETMNYPAQSGHVVATQTFKKPEPLENEGKTSILGHVIEKSTEPKHIIFGKVYRKRG